MPVNMTEAVRSAEVRALAAQWYAAKLEYDAAKANLEGAKQTLQSYGLAPNERINVTPDTDIVNEESSVLDMGEELKIMNVLGPRFYKSCLVASLDVEAVHAIEDKITGVREKLPYKQQFTLKARARK